MIDHIRHRSPLIALLLLLVSGFSLVQPASAGGPQQDPIIAGEVIVRLNVGISLEDFLNGYSATLIDSIPAHRIYKVGVDPKSTELIAMQMHNDAQTAWAEANYTGFDPEGRTGSFYVTGISKTQYQNQYARERINLPAAHALTRGGGVIIALLDTGIDHNHPDLRGFIAPGAFNVFDNSTDVADIGNGTDDDGDGAFDEAVGHGTFVAGLIRLAAPDAMILPVKVLTSDGNGDGFLWAKGIFHAIEHGADVINMSLGTTYDARALTDALTEARRLGVVVVAAAGNQDSEDLPEHPATLDDFAIGVAASDAADHKAEFSNYEKKLTITASGAGGVYGLLPTHLKQGDYAAWEGTSFSTALVSGTAALVLAANPDWPRDATRFRAAQMAIRHSATPMDDPHYQSGLLGGGLLDAAGAINGPYLKLDAITAIFGTIISGGVNELIDSEDNLYVRARSRFGFTALEPNLLDLLILYTANDPLPQMELSVRSRINHPTGTATIRLRNWATNQLQTVGQHALSPNWVDWESDAIDSATFMRAGDGRIEVRLKHTVIAVFTALGFESQIDEVDLEFN